MPCSKPLSYSNYEPILLNMAANQRILFALHCPAAQTIDKLIPLKINSLILNYLECKINNTIYDIDFLRWNHVSGTSELVNNVVYQTHASREVLHHQEKTIEFFLKKGELNESQEKSHKSKLLEVREKLDMVRPLDHTDYLQFSETNKKVMLVEYTNSALDAVEHFLQKLFGNREVIYVEQLRMPRLSYEKINRKFKSLSMPTVFELLEKFNFQVNQLTLAENILQVGSSILQKVQRLTVPSLSIEVMQKLEVKYVHFSKNLLELWIFASQWSGEMSLTRWTCDFVFSDRAAVHALFEHLAHKHGVTARENPETSGTDFPQKIVIAPKIGTSEMHVYCEYNKGYGWMLVLSFVTKF